MNMTIKQLRQQGYKVRVRHSRYFRAKYAGDQATVHARGGSTTIDITTPDKIHTVTGESFCSLEDNFNRKVGNQIALGRALKNLENIKKCNANEEV